MAIGDRKEGEDRTAHGPSSHLEIVREMNMNNKSQLVLMELSTPYPRQRIARLSSNEFKS